MGSFSAWAVVTLLLGGGTTAALQLGESVWNRGLLARPVARLLALAGSVVLVVALAALLRIHGLADADGHLITKLVEKRGPVIENIMTIVTTLGDPIPTFLIAAILAILTARHTGYRVLAWTLPLVVLVEIAAQIAVGKVLHPLTIADVVASKIPSGGVGYVPSGSVARLSSLFLVAALLWHRNREGRSRSIVTLGAILVVVEAVSRLYLGRHFLLDIVGGLALGLALFLATSLLVDVDRLGLEGPGPTRGN